MPRFLVPHSLLVLAPHRKVVPQASFHLQSTVMRSISTRRFPAKPQTNSPSDVAFSPARHLPQRPSHYFRGREKSLVSVLVSPAFKIRSINNIGRVVLQCRPHDRHGALWHDVQIHECLDRLDCLDEFAQSVASRRRKERFLLS